MSTNTPATSSYTSDNPVSTSVSENYTTIREEHRPELNNKTLTIVLATVIPTVSIAAIGFVVWMKMSSSASSRLIAKFSRSSGKLDENEMVSSIDGEVKLVDENSF